MKKLRLICLGLLWITLHVPGWAQEEKAALPPGFRSLHYTAQLPENLLYTKSVVFVNVPDNGKNNWKTLAQQAHTTFRDAGIDAVAYYYFDDVKAGRDASRQLTEELKKREIKNVIILSQGSQNYALLITPFNGESSFASGTQEAYKHEAPGFDQLIIEFGKVVARSGLEVQNHLINDQPEFFVGAGSVIKGKRFETFAQDLKLDKLAVPQFQESDLLQAASDSSSVALQIEHSNQKLVSVMETYPYEYSLVDPKLEEDKIRQDGYQYILLRLHTTPQHIQDMLGYKSQGEDQAKTTSQKPASVQTPVYKYYVKHIYTGDIYLGNLWDADENWEVALANYIRNMKAGLNIGK